MNDGDGAFELEAPGDEGVLLQDGEPTDKYKYAAEFVFELYSCVESVSLRQGLPFYSRRNPSKEDRIAFISDNIKQVIEKYYQDATYNQEQYNKLVARIFDVREHYNALKVTTAVSAVFSIAGLGWSLGLEERSTRFVSGSKVGDGIISFSLFGSSFIWFVTSLTCYRRDTDALLFTAIDIANLLLSNEHLVISKKDYSLSELHEKDSAFKKKILRLKFDTMEDESIDNTI